MALYSAGNSLEASSVLELDAMCEAEADLHQLSHLDLSLNGQNLTGSLPS